ncbi:MAG TPA: hypothetical protein VGF48_01820 [Thermoanaerobaculia bacterium]|jgi:hypothetical protein
MKRRPDLIVPIRDRRQHKRYLTLKNVGIAGVVLVAGFLIITIRGEMSGLKPGEHGRVFKKELPEPPVAAKPMEVVREDTPAVPDADSADPTLMEPMSRAQWLEAQPAEPTNTAAAMTMPTMTVPTVSAPVEGDAHIAIVGGAGGIAVVKEPRKRPVLKGGFGR